MIDFENFDWPLTRYSKLMQKQQTETNPIKVLLICISANTNETNLQENTT